PGYAAGGAGDRRLLAAHLGVCALGQPALRRRAGAAPLGGGSALMLALQAAAPATSIGRANPVAIAFFLVFIAITLGITWWAARRTTTTEPFYAAGRVVSAGQN